MNIEKFLKRFFILYLNKRKNEKIEKTLKETLALADVFVAEALAASCYIFNMLRSRARKLGSRLNFCTTFKNFHLGSLFLN